MAFTTHQTSLQGVLILEPKVFVDERGFFYESFSQRDVAQALNTNAIFVQDNHSESKKGVLRGLHYQIKQAQGKLIRVTKGEVFDVAVNLQRGHPEFGRWVGIHLSATNKRQVWVPPGFAHGFLVLSEVAELMYKTTDYYAHDHERSVLWNDPAIGIEWPLVGSPILAQKDAKASPLAHADVFNFTSDEC